MDYNRLKEMFADVDDGEYLEFERIPEAERLHPELTLCGLLKVASLLKEQWMWQHHAEHDVLLLADAETLRELTPADVLYLVRCGIHYNDDNYCLADFC